MLSAATSWLWPASSLFVLIEPIVDSRCAKGIDVSQMHLLMCVNLPARSISDIIQMTYRFAVALFLALGLSACTSLLPRGSSSAPGGFASFEQAQAAAQRIVPLETRFQELKGLGFDPEDGANVTQIPYPDLVARLAPYSSLPLSALDPGVRKCVEAQAGCRGYLFNFEQQDRKRIGGFWLDFLNIRRTTHVTGWTFQAMVVVSDGTVLFRNAAGQPRIDRTDSQRNPLGPFQPAGESAGAVILR